MNIIILGAGRVGRSVAESLVSEKNDITVIDTNCARLRQLQDRLDLRGVAIHRIDENHNDQRVLCDGSTRIEPGDEVFVLAATPNIRRVLGALRQRDQPVRRVMTAGGGRSACVWRGRFRQIAG